MNTIECKKLTYPEFYYLLNTCNATLISNIRSTSWVIKDGVLMCRHKPYDKLILSGYDIHSLFDDMYFGGGIIEFDRGASVRYVQ